MSSPPGHESVTLPDPTLTFTIPSLHDDDTILKCRVYHPLSLLPGGRRKKLAWHRNAVVFAHPYAPLGGQFDDHVVHAVTAVLLQLGYLVVTFNFRSVINF
jgi:dipeptidyl aminopeptidase/acylaminoacyl peptidase